MGRCITVHGMVWRGGVWALSCVLCERPGDEAAAVVVLWHGGVASCYHASKEL